MTSEVSLGPRPLCLRELEVTSFRNIEKLSLQPCPRFNVIVGDNGQGKTSLLEAIYFVATTKSFRCDNVREVRRQGDALTAVKARILEGEQLRQQRVALDAYARSIQVDEQPPDSLAFYARLLPVIIFHPGDLSLVSGPSSLRRTLLDRIALFMDQQSLSAKARYTRAARARLSTLEQRGIRAPELDAYEQLMAEQGAVWSHARERASAALSEALLPAFAQMTREKLVLSAGYRPGGSTDVLQFLHELQHRRAADLKRHGSSFGPTRDELVLNVDGRSSRKQSSQGQQRLVCLALKLAEFACVRQARQAEPLLLLDDVSSELDQKHTEAVYEFLRATTGQIFATTTRPELFSARGVSSVERSDYWVVAGTLRR